jgi:hypothetical protein
MTLIMMVVGDNSSRAFGSLVRRRSALARRRARLRRESQGILSLIRFRAKIKVRRPAGVVAVPAQRAVLRASTMAPSSYRPSPSGWRGACAMAHRPLRPLTAVRCSGVGLIAHAVCGTLIFGWAAPRAPRRSCGSRAAAERCSLHSRTTHPSHRRSTRKWTKYESTLAVHVSALRGASREPCSLLWCCVVCRPAWRRRCTLCCRGSPRAAEQPRPTRSSKNEPLCECTRRIRPRVPKRVRLYTEDRARLEPFSRRNLLHAAARRHKQKQQHRQPKELHPHEPLDVRLQT